RDDPPRAPPRPPGRRRRASGTAHGRGYAGSVASLWLEEDDCQRWQRHVDGEGAAVPGDRGGVDAAEVAHSAAGVVLRVGVEDLAPAAVAVDADAVVLARDGGEVAGDQHLVVP